MSREQSAAVARTLDSHSVPTQDYMSAFLIALNDAGPHCDLNAALTTYLQSNSLVIDKTALSVVKSSQVSLPLHSLTPI